MRLFCTYAVVARILLLSVVSCVGAVGLPVKAGEFNGANKFNAVWVAVHIGLLASDVLLTLPNPIIAAVMPLTVPVNVGLFKVA